MAHSLKRESQLAVAIGSGDDGRLVGAAGGSLQ